MSEPRGPSRTEDENEDRRAAREPVVSGGAIRVGSALGIPIRIHFTFLLVLVWFGVASASSGGSFLDGVVFILALFGCVALHELGHAAMARRYGVRTKDIVLYPIGGVARLDRIPAGKAEIWIALAGPMVNVLLAMMIFVGLVLHAAQAIFSEELVDLTDASLLGQLLYSNLALFAFNLIPAFPMDGGRVLRAALSLRLGQERATRIAAGVGQGFAVLFAVAAVLIQPFQPVLLLIAFFVFFGAGQEAAFERGRSAMAGLSARDAMVTKFEVVAPQDPIGRVADLLIASHQQDFPVIDAWGRIAGVLPRGGLLAALAAGGRDTAVLDVMDREPRVVPPELPLEHVFRYLQGRAAPAVLVAGPQGLLGMITLENVGELIAVSQSLRR